MLRPRKKYTVYELRQLKGKRVLTHLHVKSPEEAAAAEAAGVDLMSCPFDTPEAQARLSLLVAAAPTSFLSGSTPHGIATAEEAIRTGFRALEMGASSVYCSASPQIIEAMETNKPAVIAGNVPNTGLIANLPAGCCVEVPCLQDRDAILNSSFQMTF